MDDLRDHLRTYAWLLALAATCIAVFLAIFGLLGATPTALRIFNACLLTMTFGVWMSDYTRNRASMYRRQRRLRLAFAFFLFSGMYSSLESAFNPDGNPIKRVVLVSVASGVLLASILYAPANDDEIPEEYVFPWERAILRARARRNLSTRRSPQ